MRQLVLRPSIRGALSVAIEEVGDLVADLARALDGMG
jgi:O-acetylhomoserine/O-acetylserine sulfhydrylase-like pyridoxal-dependent enzyme